MASTFGAVTLAHEFIKKYVKEGDFCIDATAGRGNDTLMLSKLVGDSGKVIAFDVQPEAIESTKSLLNENGVKNAQVIHDSHVNMDLYAEKESVKCIVFNFGWLPGADHSVSTHADTSIEAVKKGLELLSGDGIMSLCIYYGRESGFEERDALLNFVENIDSKKYTAIVSSFVNRPNCPPIFVAIRKGI